MNKKAKSRRDFIRMISIPGLTLALTPDVNSLGQHYAPAGKRIGIIGLDTSHCTEFTKLLNDNNAGDTFHGYRVTCAYPLGSPKVSRNAENIAKYTELIKQYGVKIVSSIEELLSQVDAVLLETNDGAIHLEQATPVFKAEKPIFIDKPMGASLADVLQLYETADKFFASTFSSSSLRFMDGVQHVVEGAVGKTLGADTFSPAYIEKTHPALFWYGIHGVELLFTVMGMGCTAVSCTHDEGTDIAVGKWSDGRIGTFRGTRTGVYAIGGTVYGDKKNIVLDTSGGYKNLVIRIAEFFKTGTPPVMKEETIEIYAFMEAAEESIRQGGAYISIEETMKKAMEINKKRPPVL